MIHVYNRWGGLVFEHQGPYMNTWDGTNMRGDHSRQRPISGCWSPTQQFETFQGSSRSSADQRWTNSPL